MNQLFESYIDKLNISQEYKDAIKELRKVCLEASHGRRRYPYRDKEEVKAVQKFLSDNGYPLKIDGVIGPITTSAIQQYAKITTDKIFGKNTTAAYNKILSQLSLPPMTTNTSNQATPAKAAPVSQPVQQKPLQQSNVPTANPQNNASKATANNDLFNKYKPGTEIPSDTDSNTLNNLFAIMPIPANIFQFMQGKSYKGGAPSQSQLKYIRCLHKDISGRTLVGELVANASIAPALLSIFKKLYNAGYPIEKMRLVDYYKADDNASMTANNTSCFNFRYISGTQKISKHGKGIAIDINPLYNPCVSKNGTLVEPPAGKAYANHAQNFPYKIAKGDLCYQLFTSAGFKWGGDWKSIKDYQHFEM